MASSSPPRARRRHRHDTDYLARRRDPRRPRAVRPLTRHTVEQWSHAPVASPPQRRRAQRRQRDTATIRRLRRRQRQVRPLPPPPPRQTAVRTVPIVMVMSSRRARRRHRHDIDCLARRRDLRRPRAVRPLPRHTVGQGSRARVASPPQRRRAQRRQRDAATIRRLRRRQRQVQPLQPPPPRPTAVRTAPLVASSDPPRVRRRHRHDIDCLARRRDPRRPRAVQPLLRRRVAELRTTATAAAPLPCHPLALRRGGVATLLAGQLKQRRRLVQDGRDAGTTTPTTVRRRQARRPSRTTQPLPAVDPPTRQACLAPYASHATCALGSATPDRVARFGDAAQPCATAACRPQRTGSATGSASSTRLPARQWRRSPGGSGWQQQSLAPLHDYQP